LIGNARLQRRADQRLTQELLQLALQHVAESEAGFLLIEDLDEASPLSAAMSQSLPAGWLTFRHAGVQPRRRIRLPETPEQYWSKFSSKTRSTFRRKLKKFGQTRLDRITNIEQVPAFLEAAHRISVQTWQSRQLGLRVRNDDAERAQLTTLARLGLLRCYLWHVDGEPVAFTIGNQGHGCFHYEEVGYLTAHARNSPGQMMLLQMIDDLILHDRPEWFDFGGGDADYKQLFATHESRSGTVWLFPPTLCNRLTVAYLRGCHGLRRALRRGIGELGLASRFRQRVRYGGPTPTAVTDATPTDMP
jgi:CelD/BcsL family acetyltransferase involved in cellulose biosynthesis